MGYNTGEKEHRDMLDAKKAIKLLSVQHDVKINEIAETVGINPHSFSNWLYRPDSPTIVKVERVLKMFGCHLAIVDDETGEIQF